MLTNLVTLNGIALTDESRQPFQEDRDERSVVIDLASGKKRKFIKSIKRKWTISWENVGMNASQTYDAKGGRNEIRAIAQLGTTVILQLTDGNNGTETYTVFVDSYTETVTMRRVGANRYTLSISLVEQG